MRRGDVEAALGDERIADRLGAAAHLEAARQDAVGGKAAFDAVVHHLPEPRQALVQFLGGAEMQLVRALHRGDRLAGGRGHVQHLGGVLERVGTARGLRGDLLRALDFRLGQDEAAADGIVGLAQDHVALRVGRHQHHAVGVTFELVGVVEDQIPVGREGERRQARRRHGAGRGDVGQRRLGLLVVVGVGQEAREAEDRRAVGGMPLAGEGQRTVKRGAQTLGMERRGAERVEKARAGHHRPHRVG